jgi:hypothetical protein
MLEEALDAPVVEALGEAVAARLAHGLCPEDLHPRQQKNIGTIYKVGAQLADQLVGIEFSYLSRSPKDEGNWRISFSP